MSTEASQLPGQLVAQRDAGEPLPEHARTLLKRLYGDDEHFDWARIEGHEVWRVRQHRTGETIVAKSGANIATARAMAVGGIGPRVLAADDETGICIMEDLGSTTLLDLLTGQNADAAAQGLLGLARTLGAMHRWSSALELPRLPPVPRLPLAAFMNICGALGVDASPARGELIAAERCVRSEDPQAVVHGDPCPDNFVPGATTQVTGKFVDFEATHRGNAILETAYWHMPFPTCWRVARLPSRLLARMDASYRDGFAARRPQPLDTATFRRLLAAACVYWMVSCLTDKRFVEAKDDRFAGPGFASVRERGLLWLDNAAATIAEVGHFKAAGGVARELAERLRSRWEPMNDAPLYPAFL